MQIPKLTPLQSRLLASVVATCVLVVIWISFQPRHLVYAAELPDPVALRDSRYGDLGIVIPRASNGEVETEVEATQDEFETELKAGNHEAEGEVESEDGKLEVEGGIAKRAVEERDGAYTSDFSYFHSNVVGRQEQSANEKLTNNEKSEGDIEPGTTKNFVLEKSQLRFERLELRGLEQADEEQEDDTDAFGNQLKKRQSGNRVFISANTCRQPTATINLVTDPPPQLFLYISTSANNKQPGPKATNELVTDPIKFTGGHANFELETSSDVYIGVDAPDLTTGWNGSWHYEIAASLDGWYHTYNNFTPFTFMVDTDSESALFITYNLSLSNATDDVDKWMKMDNPFTIYTFPNDTWRGLEHSYCGLKDAFNSTAKKTNITLQRTMTQKFVNSFHKGQFHFQGLNTGTNYSGFLAAAGSQEALQLPGAGTIRDGGMVFHQFQWTTKADDSCQVLFDLDFCDTVAYAVPSSPDFKFDDDGLKALYDNQAKEYMENFNKSLAQVACNTTSTAQYSLARNCTNCHDDYKNWLCSVLIPRCEDWTATDNWLQPRNINTQLTNGQIPFKENMTEGFNQTYRDRFAYKGSRNPMIDEQIQPGPYKELLPCEDLCFDIVRSCPAQLKFACPNDPARRLSYGKRDAVDLTCNFPGAVVNLDMFKGAAGTIGVKLNSVWALIVAIGVLLWI